MAELESRRHEIKEDTSPNSRMSQVNVEGCFGEKPKTARANEREHTRIRDRSAAPFRTKARDTTAGESHVKLRIPSPNRDRHVEHRKVAIATLGKAKIKGLFLEKGHEKTPNLQTGPEKGKSERKEYE